MFARLGKSMAVNVRAAPGALEEQQRLLWPADLRIIGVFI
jgi:hypothetical protein